MGSITFSLFRVTGACLGCRSACRRNAAADLGCHAYTRTANTLAASCIDDSEIGQNMLDLCGPYALGRAAWYASQPL
jgi:hypothetical protein